MSILVITTMIGTFSAKAIPRCSLCEELRDIPTAEKGDPLAHTDQAIVGCDHQKAVIRAAAKQPKDCGPKVFLVTGKIAEAYDFGLRP